MKKSFTIGRDPQNDIVISDPSDLVSRLHATLKVDKKGHYRIMDQSTNGTYVNGIRVEKFAEVPVSRKDDITFASVASFDWDEVPRPNNVKSWLIPLLCVLGATLIGLAVYLLIINGIIGNARGIANINTGEQQIEQKDSLSVSLVGEPVLKWNEQEVKVKIVSNVKWKVVVNAKDMATAKDVTIDIPEGSGSNIATIKLPANQSTKNSAVYFIVVSTEAKVQTQSYMLTVTQQARPQSKTTAPKSSVEPKQQKKNPAIL